MTSPAATAFLISIPMACPIVGGTALPICLYLSRVVPANLNESGNPCERAPSLTLTTLCCSG